MGEFPEREKGDSTLLTRQSPRRGWQLTPSAMVEVIIFIIRNTFQLRLEETEGKISPKQGRECTNPFLA